MLPSVRKQALHLLNDARPGAHLLTRDVEAVAHSVSRTPYDYYDHIHRAAFNLRENPRLATPDLVCQADAALTEGTLLQRIERETQARADRFQQMLQEKYDAINDRKFHAIVRCRRCGSEEVSWDEKQTRSADEAATLYCVCAKCKNRWVVRG